MADSAEVLPVAEMAHHCRKSGFCSLTYRTEGLARRLVSDPELCVAEVQSLQLCVRSPQPLQSLFRVLSSRLRPCRPFSFLVCLSLRPSLSRLSRPQHPHGTLTVRRTLVRRTTAIRRPRLSWMVTGWSAQNVHLSRLTNRFLGFVRLFVVTRTATEYGRRRFRNSSVPWPPMFLSSSWFTEASWILPASSPSPEKRGDGFSEDHVASRSR